MSEPVDITSWSCPVPLRDHPNVVMGHGGGGRLSAELIEHLFVPAFGGLVNIEARRRSLIAAGSFLQADECHARQSR